MPGNDADVTIRGRVEGLDEADEKISRLARTLASMNQGASPMAGQMDFGSGLPSTSPVDSPKPPNPLEGYTVPGPSPVLPPLAPSSGGQAIWGPLQPGILAPPPLPYGPMGFNLPGQTVNVNIVGASHPIPVFASTMPGGAAGGSGTIGSGGGSGGGPINPGEGAPPPPGDEPDDVDQDGGGGTHPRRRRVTPSTSLLRFLNNIRRSPSLGGIVGAAESEMPFALASLPVMGMLAGGAAGLELANINARANLAAFTPTYATQTSIMNREAAGGYVIPGVQRHMEEAAALASQTGYNNAWMSPLTSLPLIGGLINAPYQQGYVMPRERLQTAIEASANVEQVRARAAGYGVSMPGAPNAPVDHLTAAGSGVIHMFGSETAFDMQSRIYQTQVDDQNRYADLRSELYGTASAFGQGGLDWVHTTGMYAKAAASGNDPTTMNPAFQAAAQIALQPANADIYNALANVKKGSGVPLSAYMEAAQRYADSGDSMSIGVMSPAIRVAMEGEGKSTKEIDATIKSLQDFAAAMRGITNTINIAQAQISEASMGSQLAGLTGGSYSQMAAAAGEGIAPAKSAEAAAKQKYDELVGAGQPVSVTEPYRQAWMQARLATASTEANVAVQRGQGAVVSAETTQITASTALSRATMSGGESDQVIPALRTEIQSEWGKLLADEKQLQRQHGHIPEEDYKRRAAEIHQREFALGQRSLHDIPETELGLGQPRIGFASAQVQSGIAMAQFGTPQEIYAAAQREITDVLKPTEMLQRGFLQAHGLTDADISGALSGRLTPQQIEASGHVKGLDFGELTASLGKLTATVTDETVASAKNLQALLASNVVIAGLNQSITQATTSMTLSYGAANTSQVLSAKSEQVDALHGKTVAAKLVLDNTPYKPGSTEYQLLQSGYDQAVLEETGAAVDVVNAQPSFEVQSNLQTAGILQQLASSGLLPYGMATRASAMGMQAERQDIGDAGLRRKAAYKKIDDITALTPEQNADAKQVVDLRYQKEVGSDTMQELSFFQQMQEGWQGRMTSALLGAPGRASWVTSHFNAHTAAGHMQDIVLDNGMHLRPGDWGSTGGVAGDANRMMNLFMAPRIASQLGMLGTPGGAMSAALANMDTHSVVPGSVIPNVLIPPGQSKDIVLHVTLKAADGKDYSGSATIKAADLAAATAAHATSAVQNIGHPGQPFWGGSTHQK